MARKKPHEEHENHERWLVSYADFITLLFAFFVVMYAVSSVNEGKYRVLSDALVAAFRSPTKSLMPIQVGNIVKSPSGAAVELPPMAANRLIEQTRRGRPGGGTGPGATDAQTAQAVLHQLAKELSKAFEGLIAQDLVTVRETQLWLEVEIRSAVLFDSGSAQIKPDALPVVDKVVDILAGMPNAVRVEGYTDNVPISGGRYQSNWDLSAARAASVVHRLLQRGVDPLRLSLAGYAEYRPVADNDTPDGRSRNRRVVLVVLATPEAVAQRDAELMRTRQGPDDVGFRVPNGTPDATSIINQAAPLPPGEAAPAAPGQATPASPEQTAASAPNPAAPANTPRWPADRRAAGQVPDFVPAPQPPQVVPPL